MPVPTFITVSADSVRVSDDVLVNGKGELDPNGEPHALSDTIHGEKWSYLTLATPIGRRKKFTVDVYSAVPIVRLVDTPEDIRNRNNRRIQEVAFSEFRDYWKLRTKTARELADGLVADRSYGWKRDRTFRPAGGARTVALAADKLAQAEIQVELWAFVQDLTIEEGMDLTDATANAAERATRRLTEGWEADENEIKGLREFLRTARRYRMEE